MKGIRSMFKPMRGITKFLMNHVLCCASLEGDVVKIMGRKMGMWEGYTVGLLENCKVVIHATYKLLKPQN